MKYFTHLEGGLPVTELLGQIAANPDLWDANTIRKTAPGTPHSRMSDIWVRYNDVRPYAASGDYSGFNNPHIPLWYPAWRRLPALQSLVRRVASGVEADMIGGVLITRIPPGMGIDPHVDKGWHVEYYDKFYISLQSAPGAVFGCEHDGVTEEINPMPGDLFRFDNRRMHWVKNDSDEDRITLIICLRTSMFQPHPEEQL